MRHDAFLRAPPGVKPLEVRFAHPVRLSPATHSQGHGRPCLQRHHRHRGFCRHVVSPDGHFRDTLLENCRFWATKCRFWDILCEKLKILFFLI